MRILVDIHLLSGVIKRESGANPELSP